MNGIYALVFVKLLCSYVLNMCHLIDRLIIVKFFNLLTYIGIILFIWQRLTSRLLFREGLGEVCSSNRSAKIKIRKSCLTADVAVVAYYRPHPVQFVSELLCKALFLKDINRLINMEIFHLWWCFIYKWIV